MPEDLAKLTVKELKVRLKAKGLPVSGNKGALVARLDWCKNWRTYVTNVPEEYRHFEATGGNESGQYQFGVRSVAVSCSSGVFELTQGTARATP